MTQANGALNRIKAGLRIALLTGALGCASCVVGGGYGGEVVAAPGPDVVLFGGFDRGRDVHDYSHRGAVSRGVAHPGGGGRHR